jgi:hypothetical protein
MMGESSATVGIMVAKHRERKHALQKYAACNTTNTKLFCFTPSEIDWERKSITGLHQSNGKWALKTFPFPDVVYNRCYNMDRSLVERLETVIGSNKCFNHINQLAKHEVHHHLTRWLASYLPETVLYDQELAVQMLHVHKVIYLKPCYGNNGKGVYRAELKESGEIQIGDHHFVPKYIVGGVPQFLEKMQELIGSAPYLIQQGIGIRQSNGRIFDIRVLAQKNRSGSWSVTNAISRFAHKGCFNTSICERIGMSEEALRQLYSADKAKAIIGSLHDISLRAAEILEIDAHYHLGELSVDFALDDAGHIWIIEVNGKPQKDLYNGIRNSYRVYKRPLQYARYLCKR